MTVLDYLNVIGFHKDPADQIIVATSIILGIPLLTADEKIIAYPNVITLD